MARGAGAVSERPPSDGGGEASTPSLVQKLNNVSGARRSPHIRGVQLLERSVEALPDAPLVADADGRVRLATCEAERRFGLTREALAERTIGHLIRGGLHSGRPVRGSAFSAEMIGAGGPRPVSLTLRPIDGDAGRAAPGPVRLSLDGAVA